MNITNGSQNIEKINVTIKHYNDLISKFCFIVNKNITYKTILKEGRLIWKRKLKI